MREVATIQRMQTIPPKIMLNRAWWGEGLRRTIGALLKRGVVRSLAWRRGGAFASGVTTVRLSV